MSSATSIVQGSRSEAVVEPPPWHRSAACRGLSAGLFYPVDDDAVAAAKAVCASCRVAEDCLEYAIAVREKEGLWGGATERERRSIIRRRRRAAARERDLEQQT